jgi:uncharacterized protein (TIGR00106 family)
MLIEFSVVPVGKTASVSGTVARVLDLVVRSGVPYKINPMGTVIEGEWGVLMDLLRKCHEEAAKDAERIITTIKIDDYRGRTGRIEGKIESLERALGRKLSR